MPLTEPDLWISHIRLFNLSRGTRILSIEVVPDRRLGKRVMIEVVVELFPAHASLLAPSVQPLTHQYHGHAIVAVDGVIVAAHPVVRVMPSQWSRVFLTAGLPSRLEAALPRAVAVVGEPKEVKGVRPAFRPGGVSSFVASNAHSSAFLRMDFQPVAIEAVFQCPLHALCIRLVHTLQYRRDATLNDLVFDRRDPEGTE